MLGRGLQEKRTVPLEGLSWWTGWLLSASEPVLARWGGCKNTPSLDANFGHGSDLLSFLSDLYLLALQDEPGQKTDTARATMRSLPFRPIVLCLPVHHPTFPPGAQVPYIAPLSPVSSPILQPYKVEQAERVNGPKSPKDLRS